jgi:hypothetical protein
MLVGDQVDMTQFGQVPPGYPPGYVAPPPGYPMTYAPSYQAPPGYPVPPGYPTTGYPTAAYPTGPYVPPVSTTPVPVTPTGPAGTQTIPVVQIGPVRVMDKSGYAVGGVRATVRTPGRIVKTEEVPGGIYQTTVDRSDFDAGITVIFGAPDRVPVTVPGNAIFCNTGTRNEFNAITSMTQNPCPPQSYYFEAPQQVERPGYSAPAPAPSPEAAPAPQAAQAPRRRRRRTGGGAPAEEAAPAAQAPGRVLLTTEGGPSPMVYVGIGAAVLGVIGLVFMMKS